MNTIKPSAKLIGDVSIGDGNFIGENVVLIGPLVLGDNNFIAEGVIIGNLPQDDVYSSLDHSMNPAYSSFKPVVIGSNNILREYVTIHKGALRETSIGDSNYIMTYSNIAHDCRIGNSVKIASNVNMGGFCIIQNNCYLGMSSSIHQFTVVGAISMIGMGSIVRKDIHPATTAFGVPAEPVKPNLIGLKSVGIENSTWWKKQLCEISEIDLGDVERDLISGFALDIELNTTHRGEYSILRNKLMHSD